MAEDSEPTAFDDADYQFAVLLTMLDQLPEKIREPLLQQAGKARTAQKQAHIALFKILRGTLDDVRLDVLAQKFDLDMTKREKKELQNKLEDR
jgi:hypothetical protein